MGEWAARVSGAVRGKGERGGEGAGGDLHQHPIRCAEKDLFPLQCLKGGGQLHDEVLDPVFLRGRHQVPGTLYHGLHDLEANPF